MQLWSLLFVITAVGSLISGLTGMAGGALILGGLVLLFPADIALTLHGLTQSVSNGARAMLWWRSVRWEIVLRYGLLLLPGAWLGGWLFYWFNLALVEAFLGVMILVLVWLPLPREWESRFNANSFILLGLVSGFFSMLVGVVGPLLNPFFDKLQIKRESMVATKSTCMLLLHAARVGGYTGAAGVSLGGYQAELIVMLVATILGIQLARPVGRWINDRQLDLVLKVLLTVMGSKNVISGLWRYWN